MVGLRVPVLGDSDAIAGYAGQHGGLDGVWLPSPEPGATAARCCWLIEDWLARWAGRYSHNGPALMVSVAQSPGLVGQVGFGLRGEAVVELTYGIAPAWRGRGLATRAAKLAAE